MKDERAQKKVNCTLETLCRDHLSMQNLPVLHFNTHVRVGLQCSCIREPVGWLVSWICGRFPFCLISSRGVVRRGNGHVALPEISQNTSCLIRRAHFLTYPQPFALSLSLWSSFLMVLFPNDSLYLSFLLLFYHPSHPLLLSLQSATFSLPSLPSLHLFPSTCCFWVRRCALISWKLQSSSQKSTPDEKNMSDSTIVHSFNQMCKMLM